MEIKPMSEADALRAAKRTLLKPGIHPARITEAFERRSESGKSDVMELTFEMADGRLLKAWPSNTPAGQLLLRHAADSVGQLSAYEAGLLTQDMFPGAAVRLRLSIRKRRGYQDSNQVDDILPMADSSVVALRAG
jgi:hypothetical protein